jgi:hypothetical protein
MWWFLCTLAGMAQTAPLLGGMAVLRGVFFMRFHALLCTLFRVVGKSARRVVPQWLFYELPRFAHPLGGQ